MLIDNGSCICNIDRSKIDIFLSNRDTIELFLTEFLRLFVRKKRALNFIFIKMHRDDTLSETENMDYPIYKKKEDSN